MSTALAKRIDAIKTSAGISANDVAALIGATPQTLSRWRAGTSDPQTEKLQLLLELHWFLEQLSELYEPREARIWLYERHPLLNNMSPAECLRQGQFTKVHGLIEQLHDGTFA